MFSSTPALDSDPDGPTSALEFPGVLTREKKNAVLYRLISCLSIFFFYTCVNYPVTDGWKAFIITSNGWMHVWRIKDRFLKESKE